MSEELTFDCEATKEDVADFDGRLDEFNARQTGRRDFKPVRIAVTDPEGALIGGLAGVTGWTWLYITTVWVDEDRREIGVGRRLMELAEEEGVRRGCRQSCLTSYSFQAPGFYEKVGYQVYGTLDDYPVGETMFFFRKTIAPGG